MNSLPEQEKFEGVEKSRQQHWVRNTKLFFPFNSVHDSIQIFTFHQASGVFFLCLLGSFLILAFSEFGETISLKVKEGWI